MYYMSKSYIIFSHFINKSNNKFRPKNIILLEKLKEVNINEIKLTHVVLNQYT